MKTDKIAEQRRAYRAYEEAMGRRDTEQISRMKRVLAMLAPDYDWKQHYEQEDAPDLQDELRACCRMEWVNGQRESDEDQQGMPRVPQRECGSARVSDTPKTLYRLLYLFRPAPLSFEDMYKGCLLILSTPDGRFSVAVHFFKYEIALYFWAEAALVKDEQAGQPMQIRLGHPAANNGLSIQHEEGLLFFQMIQQALDHEWRVYPGNDFEV